jgi:hypothetical protein
VENGKYKDAYFVVLTEDIPFPLFSYLCCDPTGDFFSVSGGGGDRQIMGDGELNIIAGHIFFKISGPLTLADFPLCKISGPKL